MKLRDQIFRYKVPRKSIALWWLGQSSFVCKSPGGQILALDPYLSNACKALGRQAGINMDRMVPALLSPADLVGMNGYLMTHSHEDHLDPHTLLPYRKAGGRGPFVAPAETLEKLLKLGVPETETRMFWPNKVLDFGDIRIRGTFAIPFGGDDMTHLGYLLEIQGGPKIYFTGDTSYHDVLARCVAAHKPDVLVTVINPFGNLDPSQAARLAKDIDVKLVIPCHYDLFPDNSLPPRLLRTNLIALGIGERYRELKHGRAFVFPESK
jgi:L-ascorbate 6-phosphate lactonase